MTLKQHEKIRLETEDFEAERSKFVDKLKQEFGEFSVRFYDIYSSEILATISRSIANEEENSNLVFISPSRLVFRYKTRNDFSCFVESRFLGQQGLMNMVHYHFRLVDWCHDTRAYHSSLLPQVKIDEELLKNYLALETMLRCVSPTLSCTVFIKLQPELSVEILDL
jgi:hypothetical protein